MAGLADRFSDFGMSIGAEEIPYGRLFSKQEA